MDIKGGGRGMPPKPHILYKKSNTEWIMNENVKRETVKLLEKKMRKS